MSSDRPRSSAHPSSLSSHLYWSTYSSSSAKRLASTYSAAYAGPGVGMISGPSPPWSAVRTRRSISAGGWNVTSSLVPLFAFSKEGSMFCLKKSCGSPGSRLLHIVTGPPPEDPPPHPASTEPAIPAPRAALPPRTINCRRDKGLCIISILSNGGKLRAVVLFRPAVTRRFSSVPYLPPLTPGIIGDPGD